MERGKDLTSAETAAMLQDIAESASNYLGRSHGNDKEGVTDVEFRSMMRAAAWLTEFGLWPVASNRDPIRSLTGTVVIQVTLYDYALRRGYMSKCLCRGDCG
jgi:hypothetical protein